MPLRVVERVHPKRLADLLFLSAAYRWFALDDGAGPTGYDPLIYFLVALCAVLTLLTFGLAVA